MKARDGAALADNCGVIGAPIGSFLLFVALFVLVALRHGGYDPWRYGAGDLPALRGPAPLPDHHTPALVVDSGWVEGARACWTNPIVDPREAGRALSRCGRTKSGFQLRAHADLPVKDLVPMLASAHDMGRSTVWLVFATADRSSLHNRVRLTSLQVALRKGRSDPKAQTVRADDYQTYGELARALVGRHDVLGPVPLEINLF